MAYPFGHSPDWDLLAEIDLTLYRVQVKTSTCFLRNRWSVTLCTRGGNRSWNGLVKLLDPSRCDHLFVLVGDGRQRFIPTADLRRRERLGPWRAEVRALEVERGPVIFDYKRRCAARSRLFAPGRDTRAVKGTRL